MATQRSTFTVPRMDCPSEERLIRLALEGTDGVSGLSFDLPGRRLTVDHAGPAGPILERLLPLGLGATLLETSAGAAPAPAGEAAEARTLWIVLALNAAMFLVEGVSGWLAQSSGLLADGLDMFADALVYGLSLHAVGRAVALQRRAARVAGLLQLALGLGLVADLVRRLVTGSDPEPAAMAGVSVAALGVNVASLWLLARHRRGGAHLTASYIFTASDVLANLGVMAAGGLVALTGSRLPDLAVGALVAALVLVAAARILRLR
jgi:Co/Zn/Cd efflux system component